MKKLNVFIVGLALLTLIQCKKKEVETEAVKPVEAVKSSVASTPDILDEETTYAMAYFNSRNVNQRTEAKYLPCGAEIVIDTLPVSVKVKNKTLRLTFDGLIECKKGASQVKKQGYVQFQLIEGNYWDEVGAVISKTYISYKETKICLDCPLKNEIAIYDGVETIKNVSGGMIEDAPIGQILVHEIKSKNFKVTFNDASVRVQNVSELMSAKKSSANDYEFSIVGNGAYNNKTTVALWGNTDNVPYYTVYTSPKTYQTCGGNGILTSGEAFYQKGSVQVVEVYGVNKKGIAVNNCSAYGFKSSLTKANGNVETTVVKY